MSGSWNHWVTIPSTALLAFFLFGIDELGIQIEEPFGILPLEALCDTSIEGVVMDMQASYKKGHFGELARDESSSSDDDRKPYWVGRGMATPSTCAGSTRSSKNSHAISDFTDSQIF